VNPFQTNSETKYKVSEDVILESHEDLFSSNSDGTSEINATDENEIYPMTQRTPKTGSKHNI
jgi:hypothetical protein